MHNFTGEVIPTPDEGAPYAAIIYAEDRIVWRKPVQTQEEGEGLVAELLDALKDYGKKSLH